MSSSSYDYIILGSGCSGLSLAVRMHEAGLLEGKRLLMVDRSEKLSNDRTWCFWEAGRGFFESVVNHSYQTLTVHRGEDTLPLNIAPYRYKMIRGLDFYKYCKEKLQSCAGVSFRTGEIELKEDQSSTRISINGEELNTSGSLVFNSIYQSKGNASLQLLQHFKGWVIQTEESVFDSSAARLMDFRVSQAEGATFVYVLPLSNKRALVEYTLFTPSLLQPETYDKALAAYIKQYVTASGYSIEEEEWGVIPMNNERLPFYRNGMYQLGTAGGQTKPSTGYTFQFIQKQTAWIVDCLSAGGKLPQKYEAPARFRFYDSVLLDLLERKEPPGDAIFWRLFERNSGAEVFRFLDNDTSLLQELKLISSLPVPPFLGAALRRMVTSPQDGNLPPG